ncbi:MAG: OmpP1/FadL family transporter, partial [Polyangiaceae bacterium]
LAPVTTAYYALEAKSVDAFLPQQVVVGGSWELTDRVRANADFTWVNWSAYISPVANLAVDLNIPPPQGGWPANITPPTVPTATKVVPIAMHDRLVPHLGVELEPLKLRKIEGFVRAGYEYQKTPISAQTGITNYIDRDRHSFSAGLGVKLNAPIRELPGDVRLDLHAQLSELPNGTTTKADPSDLVGDYTAGGHIWSMGFTTTVGF